MTEISSESLPESTVKPLPCDSLTEMAPVAAEPAPAKGGPALLGNALKVWWIPASYLTPYLITYLFFKVHSSEDCLMRADKVGSISLLSAALIYLIWYIDCKFGAKQILGQSRDKAAKTLIYFLAIALWIAWLGVGIAMSMSYDQVNSLLL